jgi:O-antigen/teichoic acid export membrane protein
VKRTTALAGALTRVSKSAYLASTGWLLVSAVASRMAALAATVVVSRVLMPASFGRLAVLQTAVTALAAIAGFGVGVALIKRVAEVRSTAPSLAGRYVGAGLLATAAGGLAVTALYLAAAHPVSLWLTRTSHGQSAVIASSGAILFTALLTSTQGALAGMESFRRVAISQALQSAVPSLGLIVGAELSGLNGALAGYSVASAVAAGASLVMLRTALRGQGIPIARSFDPAVWRALLRLGAAAFAASLVVTSALLFGQLILAYRSHGYAQVALFNVSYRWQLGIMLLPGTLASVLLPTMARLGAQGRDTASARLFTLNARLTAIVSAVPALLLALLAPVVLGLSGKYYSHHLAPFRILMLAAVPGALNNVLSSAGISLGAIRAWLVSDIVLALAFFATAVTLIPGHGATGLALAFLAGYVATDAALIRPILRRLHVAARPRSDPRHN